MSPDLEIIGPVSPELRLLLACARVSPPAAEENAIREMLEFGIDWVRFAQLAVDQGLAGFSGQTLCRIGEDGVPDDLRDAIRVMIERTRKNNSNLFNEFVTIIESLRSNGIEVIPLKDLGIAIQVYGDLGLRMIEALDFLVRDFDLAATTAALERLGYEREGALTTPQWQLIRHIEGRDFLANKKKQIVVRPHTKIAPLHLAIDIDYAGLWQRAKLTAIESQRLTLFAPEDHLLALVLQGGKEFWRGVISVCDIAAFIRCHAELDWTAIVKRARTQGCLQMTVLALSLARRFFKADLSEAITALEGNDKFAGSMFRRIVAGWDKQSGLPRRQKFSRDMLFLHDGLRRRARYAARALHVPEPADVHRIALPRQLHAAYVPLAIAHKHIVLPVREHLANRSRRRTSTTKSWDFAEARGEVLPEQVEFDKSRAKALEVLKADPRNIEELHELSRSLLTLNRADDAVEAYQRITKLEPDNIQAKEDLAGLLMTQERLHDAARMANQVIAARPNSVRAHQILGDALRRLGQYDEAAAAYNKSLNLDPNFTKAIIGLGTIFLELGELERARQLFRRAMELEPDNIAVLYNVVTAGKVASGDPVLKNLKAMHARVVSFRPAVQEGIHFALAKAYQDTGDRERAFGHLLEGNAIRRRRTDYDEDATLGNLQRIAKFFHSGRFAENRGSGVPSPIPVFIIGMFRSGSTLIEQIISSHPGAFGAGELPTFPQLLAERGILSRDGFVSQRDLATITSPAALRSLGTEYLRKITRLAPHAARIVDKQLMNFAYVGLIHLVLPNARIIHSIRNPVDNCLSCFEKLFNEEHVEYASDLGELGRYYRSYRALVEHWKAVLPVGVMLELEYESLVRDFENSARKIIAHCGLEWDDACLSFHETRKIVRTASIVQVRQPLYRTSIGRWRPDQEVLRPLLEGLGEHASVQC